MHLEPVDTPTGPGLIITTTTPEEITLLDTLSRVQEQLTADIVADYETDNLHILIRRPKP